MNKVKELRLNKGIQQKDLAISLGISQAAISDWERGKKNPKDENLRKLCEFFGVDERTLLGEGESFIPENPKVSSISETEQIVQHVLDKLNIQSAQTPEIRIVSGAMEKMSKDQQEQVVNVVRAMFANHPELFN